MSLLPSAKCKGGAARGAAGGGTGELSNYLYANSLILKAVKFNYTAKPIFTLEAADSSYIYILICISSKGIEDWTISLPIMMVS